MKLIVGLGNPGKKYEKTRHNVGFMVLDEIISQRSKVKGQKYNLLLARELARSKQFKSEGKFFAETYKLDNETILVKPQTFMNDSGKAVSAILRYCDITISSDLWVIHDDLDLELGRIKIHAGGPSGHHGIGSIIKEIGSADFLKFRLGIGRPKVQEDIDFLLSPFKKEELPIIDQAIKRMAQAVQMALTSGVEKAMNEFNV